MMEDSEYGILAGIASGINISKGAALVTIIEDEGSSPGRQGFMMGVFEDGSIVGTVGGGTLEKKAIEEALKCMEGGYNKFVNFKLDDTGELHMHCGGNVSLFIKVFRKRCNLLIAGGGHISRELYEFGRLLGFRITIFEDRAEYGNEERFPGCEIMLGDIDVNMKKNNIDKNSYVVIVTRGHEYDEKALKAVIGSSASYIGMIGSRNKINGIMKNMQNEGYSNEDINKVYAPIGLDLGGDTPSEIALSIISEIIMVKNGGNPKHMKEKNREQFTL